MENDPRSHVASLSKMFIEDLIWFTYILVLQCMWKTHGKAFAFCKCVHVGCAEPSHTDVGLSVPSEAGWGVPERPVARPCGAMQ